MPSTYKTPNLKLNGWVGTDKPVMEDFNNDNLILDKKVAVLSKEGAKNWDSGNFKVENGTWTPVVGGSTTNGDGTYGYNVGTYSRIGKLVYISYRISVYKPTNKPTGLLLIKGLPFNNTTKDVSGSLSAISGLTTASNISGINVALFGNAIKFYLTSFGTSLSYRECNASSLDNEFSVWGSAIYETNDI